MGLSVNECGQMGVMQMHFTRESITGPPAESEYAVEPVEVETISPSARMLAIGSPFSKMSRSIILEIDP